MPIKNRDLCMHICQKSSSVGFSKTKETNNETKKIYNWSSFFSPLQVPTPQKNTMPTKRQMRHNAWHLVNALSRRKPYRTLEIFSRVSLSKTSIDNIEKTYFFFKKSLRLNLYVTTQIPFA